MEEALTIFFAGVGGVLLGMACLYIAILTSHEVIRLLKSKKERE